MQKVAIVGASAAGLAAAETLRREGYAGKLTLIGAENHLPYDRPPLSKQVLTGEWEPDRVHLRDDHAYVELGAELILGTRATGLDIDGHLVHLDDGRHINYDGLVIATGVNPRRPQFLSGPKNVYCLRTLEHGLALKAALTTCEPGSRAVVIGAGVLGSEVAATARKSGLHVTLVDVAPTPVARQLGPWAGDLVAGLHHEHGVELAMSTSVSRLLEDEHGQAQAVELADGRLLRADIVVVAVGSDPVIDWLQDSGLALTNGVDCDEYCEAVPGIVAAGDVASWIGSDGLRIRAEDKTNAITQGIAAARRLLGCTATYEPVPFFWTDQYDNRIQVMGTWIDAGDIEFLSGTPQDRKFVAICRGGDQIIGAMGWNSVKQLRLAQPWIGRTWDEAVSDARRQQMC